MKNYLLSIIFLSLGFGLTAQDGISFESTNWEEILDIAKEQNKLVFVDAYTTWCGPCKSMAKNIFTKDNVGDYYNQNFVNVKMDMEKEGRTLGQKHNVIVYPTLLFFAPDGTLVHRSAGYHNEEQFIELGKVAVNPANRLSAQIDRYASGDRDPDFLYNYTKTRWEVMDNSHMPIAQEYLKTQNDWSTEQNMGFVFQYVNDTNSSMFDYLVDHKPAFEELFGKDEVAQKFEMLINSVLMSDKDKPSLEDVDALFLKLYPDRAKKLSGSYRMTHYRSLGDRENYANSAVDYYNNFMSEVSADELNETAWTFYEVIKDEGLLKKAVKWSKKSIDMDNSYYNNDTLAALYYKLGCKKKALKAANKAIAIAKVNGEDHTGTDELVDEIRKL